MEEYFLLRLGLFILLFGFVFLFDRYFLPFIQRIWAKIFARAGQKR